MGLKIFLLGHFWPWYLPFVARFNIDIHSHWEQVDRVNLCNRWRDLVVLRRMTKNDVLGNFGSWFGDFFGGGGCQGKPVAIFLQHLGIQ